MSSNHLGAPTILPSGGAKARQVELFVSLHAPFLLLCCRITSVVMIACNSWHGLHPSAAACVCVCGYPVALVPVTAIGTDATHAVLSCCFVVTGL